MPAPPIVLKHVVLANLDQLSRRDKAGMKELRRFLQKRSAPSEILRHLVNKQIIEPQMELPFLQHWGSDLKMFGRLCDRFVKAFWLARRRKRFLDCWVVAAGDGELQVLVRRRGPRVRVVIFVRELDEDWMKAKLLKHFDPHTSGQLHENHAAMADFLREVERTPTR